MSTGQYPALADLPIARLMMPKIFMQLELAQVSGLYCCRIVSLVMSSCTGLWIVVVSGAVVACSQDQAKGPRAGPCDLGG